MLNFRVSHQWLETRNQVRRHFREAKACVEEDTRIGAAPLSHYMKHELASKLIPEGATPRKIYYDWLIRASRLDKASCHSLIDHPTWTAHRQRTSAVFQTWRKTKDLLIEIEKATWPPNLHQQLLDELPPLALAGDYKTLREWFLATAEARFTKRSIVNA